MVVKVVQTCLLGELSQLRVDVVRAIECSPLPFAGKARIGASRRASCIPENCRRQRQRHQSLHSQPEHLPIAISQSSFGIFLLLILPCSSGVQLLYF